MDFIRVGRKVINVSLITHVNFGENEAIISIANVMPASKVVWEDAQYNKVDELRFRDIEAAVVKDYFFRNSENLHSED